MASPQYRSRFGDTTLTKVFVGGLAWETPNEELRRYFEQFGDILEAVVITDKNTGRSKGYGFVTFRDPESARRSCIEPNPIIDGRRANCNIASQGRPRPSPPRGRGQVGNPYQGGGGGGGGGGPQQHAAAPPYSRIPPPQMPPPHLPPPSLYPPPYGYVTYTADYGYQQALYNPQLPPHYHHQMYGPTSPSTVSPTYPYGPVRYTMQASPRAGFPSMPHAHRMQGPPPSPPPFIQYPATPPSGGDPSFIPSASHQHGFQLQSPPTRQPQSSADSQAPQQPPTTTTTTGAGTESSDAQ